MIVSKFIFCCQRGGRVGVWTTTEAHLLPTLDVPLSTPEFHPLHPRFPSNAWEHRGQWALHPFQIGQERELEREVICPKLCAQDS